MKKRLMRGFLLALAVLLVSYGVSFSCEIHIKETIHYDFTFPLDHHTYDYASIVDFYYGRHPDSFLYGVFIGTIHCLPDSLAWAHTLPCGFSVPPALITRAKLWIDAAWVNTNQNTVQIEGTFGWDPLNHGCVDNTTYDLMGVAMEGFWNDGALDVIVRAGEKCLRLDEAKLLLDYYEDHTDVEEEFSSQPEGFQLDQNYPNPFNPETQISFSLPERASVSLMVYNVFGQKVRELLSATLPGGCYTITWDGTDNQGDKLASGVYFCRLSAGEAASTLKMVLMK
jgi:hypothetical protein